MNDENIPTSIGADERRIRQLMEAGKPREALDQAKAHHKRYQSAESRRLLVDVYAARLTDMMSRGFLGEAGPLLDLVWERYPDAHPLFSPLRRRLALLKGDLNSILASLIAPDISDEERHETLEFLRRELHALGPLASASALPADHPLRTGARLLIDALGRVTSGPVTEDDLASLRDIPRRGPLAPWKALVHAIAAFYGGQPEECRRWIGMIASDTPPARAIPALHSLLDATPPPEGSPASAALLRSVLPAGGLLREKLAALEQVFTQKTTSKIAAAVREVLKACRDAFPDECEALKQLISVRVFLEQGASVQVREGFGNKPALRDPGYWRLAANGADGVLPVGPQILLWGEFYKHAVAKELIRPGSLVDAAFWRRIASLLEKTPDLGPPPSDISWEILDSHYAGQPDSIRRIGGAPRFQLEPDLFDLSACYRRICAVEPTSREYDRWIAEELRKGQKPDYARMESIAEEWSRAFPHDSAPLLYLMDWAEKRNALKKALGFVERAEAADPMNPKVRGARFRLFVSMFLRHLNQGKPALADKDLEQLEGSGEVVEGERPLVVAGLRVLREQAHKRDAGVETEWSRLVELSGGSKILARFLVEELARLIGKDLPLDDVPLPFSAKRGEVVRSAARVCRLLEGIGLPAVLPSGSHTDLISDIKASGADVPPDHLQALGMALFRGKWLEALYHVASCGLRKDEPWWGIFLFLRARSFSFQYMIRRVNCLTAAAAMARRDRNTPLLDEIVESTRQQRTGFGSRQSLEETALEKHRDVPMDVVRKVVEYELSKPAYPSDKRKEKEEEFFPIPFSLPPIFDLFGSGLFGGPDLDDEDDYDDDLDFDEDEDIAADVADVATQLARELGLAPAERTRLEEALFLDVEENTTKYSDAYLESLGFVKTYKTGSAATKKKPPSRSEKKKKKQQQKRHRR